MVRNCACRGRAASSDKHSNPCARKSGASSPPLEFGEGHPIREMYEDQIAPIREFGDSAGIEKTSLARLEKALMTLCEEGR
jgi:hypothetical protein